MLKDKVASLLGLVLDPGAIRAIATWPKFSATSFKMISALARQGIAPGTVIDVGANVGQFAIASAMIWPDVKVHSFEPVPETVSILKENVRKLPNIKVYPMALGERQGECSFHVNSYSHSSSILSLAQPHRAAFPEAQETRTMLVELTTLDKVFADLELTPPVLLKLDVQGYEVETLNGGQRTLQRCEYVILEASFKPMYEGEVAFTGVLATMERLNYEFLRPVGWLSDPSTGEVLQVDALFRRRNMSSISDGIVRPAAGK
jgi:FkbM family methyltransferase